MKSANSRFNSMSFDNKTPPPLGESSLSGWIGQEQSLPHHPRLGIMVLVIKSSRPSFEK